MNYLIVGTGGTGGCIGGYLAADGKDVTLIARGAHLAAIREHGLVVHSTRRGELVIPNVKAASAEEYNGKADVIFVCVKDYSVDEIIPLLEKASHKDTVVIPVMNGIGAAEKLQKALKGITVLDGCIYISAYRFGNGEITQCDRAFRLVFGEQEGNAHQALLEKIAEDLHQSGINTVLSDDIRRDTFIKFSFISPVAAAGSYYGEPAGPMQKEGEKRDTLIALMSEIEQIGKKMGLIFEGSLTEKNIVFFDKFVPDGTSSLQRDLEKGGKSEIDGLIFEVVRLGRVLKVAVPTYEKIAKHFGFSE